MTVQTVIPSQEQINGQPLTVEQLITEYLDYLHAVGRRSPATISAYRSDLSKFRAFLGDGGQYALSDIDAPVVERWIASMRGLSTATVRRAVHALSALYRWAIKFGHTKTNPIDRVDTPKAKIRIQPCPRPGEVKAMIEGCNGDGERAALLALATSGLRRAELLALTWQDVDLQRRRLRIRGKGDKEREVLVFEELGATPEDMEGMANYPRSVQGVEVGVVLNQTDDGSTKVSFRSNGDLDVNALARAFGGGGHVRASGARVTRPLAEVREEVLKATRDALGRMGGE